MLKVLWNLVDRTRGDAENTQPAGQALFEPLEPRLLLNADLADAQPLHTEIVSTDYAIHVDLSQQNDVPQVDMTPVLTLDLDAGVETPDMPGQDGPVETDPAPAPNLSQTGGDQVQHHVIASAESSVAPDLLQDEQGGPAVPDRQDIVVGAETPVSGIRGPPGSLGTLHLPDLQLLDPDISHLQGQIIYLDFDGAEDVTYHGPVAVGPFDVSAFSLEGTVLAGQEGVIIARLVDRLQQTFAGSGVIFTSEQPAEGTPYSTLRIGGDDSAFSAYGSFLGLAEQVDAANAVLTDDAFVFSAKLLRPSANADDLVDQLSRTIAHEVGHLLGYGHVATPGSSPTAVSALSEVALPEITVLGNAASIADGDTTPSAGDHTDFGSVALGGTALSRTFTVRNDGTTTLTLGSMTVPTGFTLTEALSGTLVAGASDTFTVQLNTDTVGTKAGDLSFPSDDPDEDPFNFRITGIVTAPEVTILGNGISIAHEDTTPSADDHTNFGSVTYGGTAVSRTFTVRNDGTSALTLGAVTVPTGYTLTEALVTELAPGAWDTFTIRLNTTSLGAKTGDVSLLTNDADENPFEFRIAGTVTMPLAEQFEGGGDNFDLANKAIVFTPNGSGYILALRSITELPTSAAGSTRLTLDDDDAVQVSLVSGKMVRLHGLNASSFWVGSNGYITFTAPDTSYWETLDGHFSMLRISALYDDLNPTTGGQVGWQQFDDRAVVTWEQVPDYETGDGCTFQVTMYFDGRIELAWLTVASPDGIVGLSNGSGLPDGFTQTDFSQAPPGPPEIAVQGNGISITNGDSTPGADDSTDFGILVQGGGSISRVFTVRNEGLSTLTLGTVTIPNGYILWEPLSTSLAPGATDTFTVLLETAVAGTKSGDISFSTNDGDENPFHFRITGTILVAPEITVIGNGASIDNGDTNPENADHTDFGSVLLDGIAAYRTFTVRNDGGSILTLGTVTVPTGFTLTEGLVASLDAGAWDTFTVQLDTAPAGAKDGDIIIATNDPDESSFHFRIAGAVVESAAPEIDVRGNGILIGTGDTTPSPFDNTDFGTTDVGRLLTRTFTIDNTGLALLSLTGSPLVTVSGSADFSVVVQPADTVAPDGSTTFQIQFRPSSTGTKTATVSIASNDGDENPYTFSLQGAGVSWDFTFYDNFDDGDFSGWSAVDPLTGAPTTAPDVVASPEGFALRGIGSGYVQDPILNIILTRDLPTGNLGELKIEMRAKAGPDRPNAAQLQLINGTDYYTLIDYALDNWDTTDKANWNSWVDSVGQQVSYAIGGAAGEWHDFAWMRDAQGRWSLSIDGQLQAANFQTDYQLRSFTKVAVSLLRNQSEIEWISISGNTLPPSAVAVPVYRFWSRINSHHFYTTSARERDKLIEQLPYAWAFEGIAFYAFPDASQVGTVPVYRLWSARDNLHLFTLDLAQKQSLLANNPVDVWRSEGIAFYIYPVASHPAGTAAVYRFLAPRTNTYFFTMSTVERDHIRNTYHNDVWTYEDEIWYAFDLPAS